MNWNIIKLLLVEDSSDDAALLVAEVQREGHAPMHKRVETETDFLAALQKYSWDAIICDYALPQFSGPEALRLLRQQGLDTPFIMVSGVCGEEEAVAMMKAGANDYIMKRNLGRLVPALERELAAALARHFLKCAIAEMQFLAGIVESSADAIYGKNLDSIIVSWNMAAERLLGYSSTEIIGCSNVLLFPGNSRDEMLDIMTRVRRGDVVAIQETVRLHKHGGIIPVAISVSPVKNTRGDIIGASTVVRHLPPKKSCAGT
ncbi:MAG: PAS domain S-box protein [Verrucomicrobiota bacterium]|jgi:PAS domain S-box-containing protein